MKEKWQPVMLVFNRRLECRCGALAIIITGTFLNERGTVLEGFDAWCQDCYEEAPREGDDDK